MRPRKISGRYLSERVPNLEPERKHIDANDFALGIEKFANDYLRGAMEVEICGKADGVANVSEAYTAYLVRSFLAYASIDEMLNLKITLGENLTISVSFRTLPNAEKLAQMTEIARMAGYRVSRDGSTLTFTAEIYSSKALQIYAISITDFIKELENVVFM